MTALTTLSTYTTRDGVLSLIMFSKTVSNCRFVYVIACYFAGGQRLLSQCIVIRNFVQRHLVILTTAVVANVIEVFICQNDKYSFPNSTVGCPDHVLFLCAKRNVYKIYKSQFHHQSNLINFVQIALRVFLRPTMDRHNVSFSVFELFISYLFVPCSTNLRKVMINWIVFETQTLSILTYSYIGAMNAMNYIFLHNIR